MIGADNCSDDSRPQGFKHPHQILNNERGSLALWSARNPKQCPADPGYPEYAKVARLRNPGPGCRQGGKRNSPQLCSCFAAEKAMAAFSQGRNIAKDPGLEILRYASGERQINGALDMGLADSTERIALILTTFGKSCSLPDDSELSEIVAQDGKGCAFQPEAVKKTFCISPEEIDAVGEARIPDLVLERVALVDTYR